MWIAHQVFIAMAVFLGDGLYHFTKIAVLSMLSIKTAVRKSKQLPVSSPPPDPADGSDSGAGGAAQDSSEVAQLTQLRNRVFLSDPVPW
jgi:hypothetical protein